jgi:hypothetical protein
MTTPNQILVDLISGQATADAIAEHLHAPMLTIKAMCERHCKDGLLETIRIADGTLTAYHLTEEGRAVASALNLQPA